MHDFGLYSKLTRSLDSCHFHRVRHCDVDTPSKCVVAVDEWLATTYKAARPRLLTVSLKILRRRITIPQEPKGDKICPNFLPLDNFQAHTLAAEKYLRGSPRKTI